MKTCADCGHDNGDDAKQCLECRGASFKEAEARPELEYVPLQEEDKERDWVTLAQCRNLVEADMIAMQLRAADIPVLIPDEFTMQAFSLNVNMTGFGRLQVPPGRYEEARALLEAVPIPKEAD